MNNYIIVMDNNSMQVHAYPVPDIIPFSEEEEINPEEFIQERGHKLSEVSWMGPCELDLQIHKNE